MQIAKRKYVLYSIFAHFDVLQMSCNSGDIRDNLSTKTGAVDAADDTSQTDPKQAPFEEDEPQLINNSWFETMESDHDITVASVHKLDVRTSWLMGNVIEKLNIFMASARFFC